MVKPIDVKCPKCLAAVTARCTKRNNWGQSFIDDFHPERIEKATESNTETQNK